MFSAKFIDHGSRRSDGMRALTRWRHPVASSEAKDVIHWVMCPASHRRIHMAIEIASDLPVFSVVLNLLFAHHVS